jgi:hypothetical protein
MPNSKHLTHGISNLVSLITKTKLGLSTTDQVSLTVARQVGGVRTTSQASKMVIIPDSVAMADGLLFTISQITWTTDVSSFTATAMKEVQI